MYHDPCIVLLEVQKEIQFPISSVALDINNTQSSQSGELHVTVTSGLTIIALLSQYMGGLMGPTGC